MSDERGFSLIEALVALAILAIATVGLVGAVEQHIDSTRAMERRAAATWIAENRLAELGLGGALSDDVTMLGERWRIGVTRSATDDPAIERVRVAVFADRDPSPMTTLDGFVEASQSPRS